MGAQRQKRRLIWLYFELKRVRLKKIMVNILETRDSLNLIAVAVSLCKSGGNLRV